METNNLKPEQLKVINHEKGNILVSASAGSGKTFAMIQRLIRLITEGKASVTEILAVTFTEAAAADMKEKLKKALTEEIERGNEGLADELNKVSTADISTLHAFCGRIIKTYFFAAGVSPDYKVADQSETAVLKEESLEETFAEFYKEKDADFLALVDRFRARRKDGSLKKIIQSIYDFCESESDPDKLLLAYKDNFTVENAKKVEEELSARVKELVRPIIEELIPVQNDCKNAKFDDGVNIADALIKMFLAIEKDGLSAVDNIERDGGYPVMTKKKAPEGVEYVKGSLQNAREALKKICNFFAHAQVTDNDVEVMHGIGQAFYKVVVRFGEVFAQKKRDGNMLDFSDLERFALKALGDQEVKNAVRAKYKYVFVDEYQDINGVQEEIISAVSNGNLFMVGDVKQSIYGFRGCRSEIFEEKQKNIESEGGVSATLNCNFRSAQKVLDLVNDVFSFCYVPKYTGLDYRGTAKLIGGGIYPEGAEGRAQIHYLVKKKEEGKEKERAHLYNILEEAKKQEEKEATEISNLLTEIIDDELTKEFYDVKTKSMRPITLGDIAVLTRTGDGKYAKGIVEGLNGHGIRVVSGVSQNVCDFPEIQTLVNVLKLIDCFYQDAPLVCTLLSPIGGFTEEELTDVSVFYADYVKSNKTDKIKRGGFTHAFEYYIQIAETSLKDRLVEFKNYFDGVRALADFKGAKGILDKIIADKGYENFLLAESDGEEKIGRLYKFLAETVDNGKVLSVGEFLRRVEVADDAFNFYGGGEEDAVKLTTIHSSKGLEFPVVIVCGLERPFNRQDEINAVLMDREKGLFPYSYDDENRSRATNGYRQLAKIKMRELQIKEEMRVFYVALTRAKYSLHLVFEKDADVRNDVFAPSFIDSACYLDFVPAYIPATEHSPERFGLSAETKKRRTVLVSKVDGVALQKMAKDFSFRYTFIEATALPLKSSVTSAAHAGEEVYPVRAVFGDEDTGAERGIIAHRIMEHFDFNGEFYPQIALMTERGVITEDQKSQLNLERIKSAIDGANLSGLTGKKLYREQDFIVNIPANALFGTTETEPVLVQGVIDLLAISENGAEIIDYKYSVLKGENLKNKYAKQLDLYAYAVETSLGIKVIGKTLVNIFTGEVVKVD